MRICDGRIVAISGAGRGVGRAYAHEFARHGAKVIVNDLGGRSDPSETSIKPADEVVAEIRSLGGDAIANYDDVSDWQGARSFVQAAIDNYGKLDVLINNAGIIRDRTIANMSIEEWDDVIRVHLRGTFAPTHWAANHWKERSKSGEEVSARLINTTSSSGIFARPGQANYAAAKAGIASLSIIAARELERYGVTANAIYPTARTRMTADLLNAAGHAVQDGDNDRFSPEHIAPLVVWLASGHSGHVTGRVFGVMGGRITLAEGWSAGPVAEKDGRWEAEEFDVIVADLLERGQPPVSTDGTRGTK